MITEVLELNFRKKTGKFAMLTQKKETITEIDHHTLYYRFQTFNMTELLENPKKILKISDSYQDTFVTPSVLRSDSKQFFERSEQNQATQLDLMFSTTSKVSSHSRKRYDTQVVF